MERNQIIADIKDFVEKNILAGGISPEADTNLQDAGIDSFSIVEIILFIQGRYGLNIQDEQMLPENFRTLGALADLVLKLSAQ